MVSHSIAHGFLFRFGSQIKHPVEEVVCIYHCSKFRDFSCSIENSNKTCFVFHIVLFRASFLTILYNNQICSSSRQSTHFAASISMTFLVSVGFQMADECVKLFHCGTHATGWLKNGHPAQSDGAVLREVCFHWLDDCCYFKQQILVRRCKTFYVYEFPGTGKSFLRYCGNGTAVHNHWKKQ